MEILTKKASNNMKSQEEIQRIDIKINDEISSFNQHLHANKGMKNLF
jgi:hypothetical protein